MDRAKSYKTARGFVPRSKLGCRLALRSKALTCSAYAGKWPSTVINARPKCRAACKHRLTVSPRSQRTKHQSRPPVPRGCAPRVKRNNIAVTDGRKRALHRTLEATLALEALRMALGRRRPKPGLVHHSDRGVQYASLDYTAQLEQHGIRISMSRTAMPYDNAQVESFIKTLKYEEVYRTEYRNLEEARASIGEFLEKIYNQERAGLSSTAAVRTQLAVLPIGQRTRISFLRHEEIYRSDKRLRQSWERQPVSSLPVLIGCDEFPVGYSSTGCPPAEPGRCEKIVQ